MRSVFILAPIEHKASSLACDRRRFSGAALDGPIASATAASATTAAASAATAANQWHWRWCHRRGVSVHSMLEGISSSVAAAAAAIASLGGGDDAYLMVQMRCGRRARDGNGNGADQQQREEEEQLGEWSAPVMIGARSGNVAHDSLSFAGTGVWATPTAARAFAQGAAAVASGGSGVSGAVSAPQASHATDLLSTVANRFVQRCRSLAVASCRLQSSTQITTANDSTGGQMWGIVSTRPLSMSDSVGRAVTRSTMLAQQEQQLPELTDSSKGAKHLSHKEGWFSGGKATEHRTGPSLTSHRRFACRASLRGCDG